MRSKTKCSNQPIVLHSILLLKVGLLCLFLSACGGGSSGSTTANSANIARNNAENAEIKLAQAVYFDLRTPADFYKETLPDDAYYVTTHLKNTDLLTAVAKVGVSAYELTSNDFSEALAWSEQTANLQASYRPLVDNKETMLYQQFTRVDPLSPELIHLHRVLKADVIDRNGIDDTYKGRITASNLSVADVKMIIEYLWTFTTDNNYGNAVVSSHISEDTSAYIYNMRQVKLNMSFDGGCDTVEVYDINYTVSKSSGFIMKDKMLQQVIKTSRTGDVVRICDR